MSEDAYQPGDPRDKMFAMNRGGKTLATKQQMLKAAADNGGKITVIRLDRESGQAVADEITFDMPLDEIVL